MRSDVHSLALRAAAKMAFSVAFVGGCSSSAPGVPADDYPGGEGPATAESGYTHGGKPCTKDASAPPRPALDCDALVNAAFPDAGAWPDGKPLVSKEVASCCEKIILGQEGDGGRAHPHRWTCCAALDWGQGSSQELGTACTPWGPPVPPAMRRRESPASSLGLALEVV